MRCPKKKNPNDGISKAKNFDELFQALDIVGRVQGTKEFYSVERLKEIISLVRKGSMKLNVVPRGSDPKNNLRKKVDELIKLEKQ